MTATPTPDRVLPRQHDDPVGIEVLEEIGRGSQAVVHRVRRGGSLYAMKVLRPSSMPDESAHVAFRREVALLASVRDPGLAQVHDVGSLDGSPYLLMDLVEGPRLTDRLSSGALPEPELTTIAISVAGALSAAHRVGLVHRDVKPDNIMLGPDGRGRLVDFGLVARVEDDADGIAVGTLTYCAPEQSGMLNRTIDGRSDLYALGAVLYECATGAPPFAAADVGELLRRHATAPVPNPRASNPHLSPAVAGIIRRLLAKDPDDRYQGGAGLLADLHRAAAEPGTADFPLGTADEPAGDQDWPLVGRHDELGTLDARWDEAVRGRGGVVLVQGAPGSGKSRLVRELTATAGRAGHLVLHGGNTPDDVRPFAALRRAVDDYVRAVLRRCSGLGDPEVQRLRAAAGETAALVKNLSPALAEALGAADPIGEVSQERYVAAVAGFLAELARRAGGGLLHIDDVQWADEATVQVLDQLSAIVAEVPLLVVVTARDDTPGAGRFAARLGARLSSTVVLEPLDATAVGELVAAVNGGMRIGDEVAARLAARSHGNPFTLLEYVNAVIDAGLIRVHWGSWRIDVEALDDLELPADAAALVLKRVDALNDEGRRVLGTAAAIGSRFTTSLVAELFGHDRKLVPVALADAARLGLVEFGDDDGCAFLHDRIREALAGQFDPAALRHLHDRIADLLDRHPDADPQAVYALAQHRANGNPEHDPAAAYRCAHAAGALALGDHAPDAALVFLQQATAAARRAGIAPDHAFGWLLAHAYHGVGRLDEAIETLQQTLATTTDPMRRAQTLYQLSLVHETAWNSGEQIRANERALFELGALPPGNPVVRVVSSLVLFVAGCLIWLTRIGYGSGRPRTHERYRLLCSLYESTGAAYVRELQPRMAMPDGLRAPYLAGRAGPSAESARMMGSISYLCRMARMHGLAERLSSSAARTAAELGDHTVVARIAWMRGIAMHGTGVDSGECLRRVLDEHHQWLDFGLYLDAYAVLSWDWMLRGDMVELEAGLARSRTRAMLSRQEKRSGVVASDACLLAMRGRAGEAAAHLATLVDAGAPLHQRVDVLIATLHTMVEQHDVGAGFEAATAEFDSLKLKPLDLLPAQHNIYVYCAYGELERCRRAADADRPARLAAARTAAAGLAKATQRPIVAAHLRVVEAALLHLGGTPAEALAKLAAAEPVLRAMDAPLVDFEAALVAARALRTLGVSGQSLRRAGAALALATEQGWPHRARRLIAEFGLSATRTAQGGSAAVGSARHSQQLAALKQVSIAASRVLDPAKLVRIALDETIRIMGAERAFVLLNDGVTTTLGPHVGRDAHGNDLPELTGYSASLIDRVRQDRQALVVTGTDEGEALGAQSILVYGLRSILVAPLLLGERLLGVIYLDSRVAKGVFTTDDVEVLTAITHHVAVSLETARTAQLEWAVATAHRQRDLAETMRQAMASMSGSLDPQVVLRRLLTSVVNARGGDDRACLVLATPGMTTVAVLHGTGDDIEEALIADLDPAVGALFDAVGAGLHTGDAAWSHPTARMLAAATGTAWPGDPASWMIVPLVTRDAPLGVLVVSSAQPGAYGDADLEILAALAGQGMVAYENAQLFSRIHHLATVDGLTGIANRRHFFEVAGRELAVARRTGTTLGAMMVDIDHFKQINDTYGHQVGDEVIRGVVAALHRSCRETDLLARYGGEEFVLLLPNAGADAPEVAERLRAEVTNTPIETAAGPVPVTVSVGVAYLQPSDTWLDTLLARADGCLYRAKETGRNRVVLSV